MAKTAKIVQNQGGKLDFKKENGAVWIIKADFKENCPKIRRFWIIPGWFQEKLSKIVLCQPKNRVANDYKVALDNK